MNERMGVYVVIIDHKYGIDCEVYSSYDAAQLGLYEYVKEWWTDGASVSCQEEDIPPASEAERAIELFFENHEREFYDIQRRWVNDGSGLPH